MAVFGFSALLHYSEPVGVRSLPRIALVLALAALAGAALAPAQAAEGKGKNFASEIMTRADELAKEEKLVEAGALYRKLLFANPKDDAALKKLRTVNTKISEKLVDIGVGKWEEDREEAGGILRAAARLQPEGKAVQAAFKERGFKLHEGEWRTEAEIDEYKRSDKERGDSRREELRLNANFKIIRQGVFRIFTDVAGGKTKIELMLNALQAHYDAYCEFIYAFSPRFPSEGLDVVFFMKREDYKVHMGSDDTLGLYVPKAGASFFFLTGEGEDFATLLHEMTHQLNDKVGEIDLELAALEEGLAEYFGYAQLTSGNRKIQLGKVHGPSVQRIREALYNRDGEVFIPLEELLRARRSEKSPFYQQSWGVIHLLRHDYPNGRLILFEAMASVCRRPEVRHSAVEGGFHKVLEEYGSNFAEFEKVYRKFYAEVK
ncbi:MAG: DUF1570 domain-containing protein [Planctomycetes bacterium]|nr:DUF1570 domain-containing protein [Planctomycetota bacterium]